MDTTIKPLVVAEITTDHLANMWDKENSKPVPQENRQEGKQFHYEAMCDWWGWHDLPDQDGWLPAAKTRFKLYDDDGEHYYSGWLLNDDECIVQQFVLDWAKYDSGCTTITIFKDTEVGYVQEIG